MFKINFNNIQKTMSDGHTGLITLLCILGLNFFSVAHAQDYVNNQSAEEQQRIREMRLLEWYALQHQNGQAGNPAPQNVSGNQPHNNQQNYQQGNTSNFQTPVAAPEAEDLFTAANAGNVNQIRTLLSQGLDINISNQERETALHMAAARGHYSAVIFLVNNGAYVNARTVKNWIPLHHAVRFRHPNIVNYLVKHGASAYSRTSDGLTAVDMAQNNNDYRLLSILGAR